MESLIRITELLKARDGALRHIAHLKGEVHAIEVELRGLGISTRVSRRDRPTTLTRRQQQIVDLLSEAPARPWSAGEIAARLNVSIPNVRVQLSHLIIGKTVVRAARNQYRVADSTAAA